MKQQKTINWIAIFAILVGFMSSCKEGDNEIQPAVTSSGLDEEINIIKLTSDPDFISKEEISSGRIEGGSPVYVSRVCTYLNKMEGAIGKVYYKIYRTSDNTVVAQSSKADVRKLATHSSSSVKYTSLYYEINKDLEYGEEYKLEVVCEGCSADVTRNVHWWRSNGDEYPDGILISNSNQSLPQYDFSFSIEAKSPNGTNFKSAHNSKRQVAYAINFLDKKAAQTFKPDGIINFEDQYLEESIRAELQISNNEPIRYSDVEGVTSLRLWGGNIVIRSIVGLEHFKDLTKLDLYANRIADLTPLQGLTNLTWLSISFNYTTNIDALQNLTKLTHLDISINKIKDISVVKNFSNLQYLNAWENKIEDLTPLKNLNKLTILDLSNNYEVMSYTPLYSLSSTLERLDLFGVPFTELHRNELRSHLPNTDIFFG